MRLSILLSALWAVSGAFAANSWIVPGAVWYDTSGNKIDAHGGGIVKRGSTFYWVGQSAANSETPMMYQSTDLLNWQNLGAQASITGLWRPKFAKPNGSYWIFGQQDRYSDSLVSSAMVGGYQQHAKVYLPPHSYSYSDTGMFYDDSSETWYLLTSADHNIVQINAINSDGSLGTEVSSLAAGAYEAPGLFKANGIYFLIVSGKTGWRANPNKVFTAPSISGPWSGGNDIAPEAENTYGSQNTFELVIAGSSTTTYIYMGDAWDSSGGTSSNYVWLPMAVNAGAKTVTLQYYPMWKVDINTGVVTTSSAAASQFYASNNTASPLNTRITNEPYTILEPGQSLTFSNLAAPGGKQWVKLHYSVSDPALGEAIVWVNGETEGRNVSTLNSRAGYAGEVPVLLDLKEGAENEVRVGVVGGRGFEVWIQGVSVVGD